MTDSTKTPGATALTSKQLGWIVVACLFAGGVAGWSLRGVGAAHASAPAASDAASNSAAAAVPDTSEAAAPAHNWETKDGLEYGYASALSDDQQKAGQAAADVHMFRYLGVKDGVYTLSSVDNGSAVVSTCTNPCEIIKTVIHTPFGSTTQHYEFVPGSVIGAVFQDAFDGQLEVYHKTAADGD